MDQHPTLQHAETHPHYQPKPHDHRAEEGLRIARSINELKVTDPHAGFGIHDQLVDQLIAHTIAITPAPDDEPRNWTAPQRCVWRSAEKMSQERRWGIVHDRSLSLHIRSFAVINAGRWLVSCPFPNCHGAQFASFLDRRFFCVHCENRAADGRWIEVEWPDNPCEIERWLEGRPTDAKNWTPGETADDIASQDAEYGRKYPISNEKD